MCYNKNEIPILRRKLRRNKVRIVLNGKVRPSPELLNDDILLGWRFVLQLAEELPLNVHHQRIEDIRNGDSANNRRGNAPTHEIFSLNVSNLNTNTTKSTAIAITNSAYTAIVVYFRFQFIFIFTRFLELFP